MNRGDDFLEAAERRRRACEDFDFPALRFRVAGIHAEELRGKERGFIASGAGADFHDDALFVVGIFREEQEFQFALDHFLARGEFLFFLLRHLLHLGVFRLEKHLVGAGQIFFNVFEFAVLGDDLAELGLLLGNLLETRGVRDDLRRGEFVRERVVASAELIQLFR